MNEYLIALFEQQWREEPQSRIFLRLAEEYRKGGLFDKAVQVCEEGLAHHPNYVPALVCLGRCLFHLGKNDEAEKRFQKVLSFSPDNSHALRGLGEINESSGRLDQAIQLYESAAYVDPSDEALQEKIASLRERQAGEDAAGTETTDDSFDETTLDLDETPDFDTLPEAQTPEGLDTTGPLGEEYEADTLPVADEPQSDPDTQPIMTLEPSGDLVVDDELEPDADTPTFDDLESPTLSEESPSQPVEPQDIDLEFERAMQEDDSSDDALFDADESTLELEEEAEPTAPTEPIQTPQPIVELPSEDSSIEDPPIEEPSVAATTWDSGADDLLTRGLKHEKHEHYEASRDIYLKLQAQYPGHPSVLEHLQRVNLILNKETVKSKKIRTLSNWLEKIKGVYDVS